MFLSAAVQVYLSRSCIRHDRLQSATLWQRLLGSLYQLPDSWLISYLDLPVQPAIAKLGCFETDATIGRKANQAACHNLVFQHEFQKFAADAACDWPVSDT